MMDIYNFREIILEILTNKCGSKHSQQAKGGSFKRNLQREPSWFQNLFARAKSR